MNLFSAHATSMQTLGRRRAESRYPMFAFPSVCACESPTFQTSKPYEECLIRVKSLTPRVSRNPAPDFRAPGSILMNDNFDIVSRL